MPCHAWLSGPWQVSAGPSPLGGPSLKYSISLLAVTYPQQQAVRGMTVVFPKPPGVSLTWLLQGTSSGAVAHPTSPFAAPDGVPLYEVVVEFLAQV